MKKGEGERVDDYRKLKNRIYNKTKKNMEEIGTFRPEFEAPVRRYAELRMQFDILNEQWYEDGCQITEDYTNKGGATNKRKTVLYLSLETLRKELIELENLFGLTPRGLKAIRAKGLEREKGSALDAVLTKLDG